MVDILAYFEEHETRLFSISETPRQSNQVGIFIRATVLVRVLGGSEAMIYILR